jgi:hypothetical protein
MVFDKRKPQKFKSDHRHDHFSSIRGTRHLCIASNRTHSVETHGVPGKNQTNELALNLTMKNSNRKRFFGAVKRQHFLDYIETQIDRTQTKLWRSSYYIRHARPLHAPSRTSGRAAPRTQLTWPPCPLNRVPSHTPVHVVPTS